MTATWNDGITYLQGGVILAVKEIREYRIANPQATFDQAAEVRASVSTAISRSDFLAAARILNRDDALAACRNTDRRNIGREVLTHVIQREMPPWAQLIPDGRRPVLEKTRKREPNVFQCFDYAELLDNDDDTLRWWTEMKRYVRGKRQLANDEIGDEAEQITIDFEKRRLAKEGYPELLPIRESVEDERRGYDIQSWDVSGAEPRPIYIESKGCRKPPLSFHLSPNQCTIGRTKKQSWFVYLWDMSNPGDPYIITYDEIEPHLATNQGSGEWKSIQISWPPRNSGVVSKNTAMQGSEANAPLQT